MSAHAAHADHKTRTHPDAGPFVRVGDRLIAVARVDAVELPADDPAKPLVVHLTGGTHLSLSGDEAAAFLAALGHADPRAKAGG